MENPSHAKQTALPAFRVEHSCSLVIFGATGDLTRRKLLPGLYVMFLEKLLPEAFAIIAFARREYGDDSYRALMAEEIRKHSRVAVDEEALGRFLSLIYYHQGDLSETGAYGRLQERFQDGVRFPANKIFYLATAPDFFGLVIRELKQAGLISEYGAEPWTRVVIEKPFGRDLASALELNQEVLRLVDESQVYRIDHYLGKETAQNILSFRFANALFEPVFNNSYVDHIQVTACEPFGMESGRGAYYDTAGGLRDMMQNHLLQLLCLVTMEPPSGLAADAVRNEKVKILQSIRPPKPQEVHKDIIRGQYGAGVLDGASVDAYIQEDRVPRDSKTETYVAGRFFIENWRWAGVPMYLRTGKRLKKKMTCISVQFKTPPLTLFKTVQCEGDVCDLTHAQPNVLTFHITPNPGITLSFSAKRPAMQVVVESAKMDFNYSETWRQALPEAYERLLLDVMRGDSTLFTRSDEVEAAWRVMDPILQAWQNDAAIPVYIYQPGTWGPLVAENLFHAPGRDWVDG